MSTGWKHNLFCMFVFFLCLSHCTYVINAAIKAMTLASFSATTNGVISLLVWSIKTDCGISLLWFYKGVMQKGSVQTCKKEKTFKRMLRTSIKKTMQMEMPDLKHATYLHAVVQLVVVSLCLRSVKFLILLPLMIVFSPICI